MTKPEMKHEGFSLDFQEDTLAPACRSNTGYDLSPDHRHLAKIVMFLGHEIDRSVIMLRDLAALLSEEICALRQVDSVKAVQEGLIASTIALQNEDRIQQRLCDLRTVLGILEDRLGNDVPTRGGDLDQEILEKLRLEETRDGFSFAIGIIDDYPKPKDDIPSLGDVDLF